MESSIQYARVVSRLNEYHRAVPHPKLYYEAQKGNIDYLRAIYHGHGYVQYDQCITQAALRKQQYEFWKEFVHLSKRTLPRENYPWDARIQVITDLFVGFRGPEEFIYELYRTVYDNLLLSRPISLDTTMESLERDLSCELEADLYVALALHPPRRTIVHFMVTQKGFRFKVPHLELAQLTFDRDLVLYVRQHLHPDCLNSAVVLRCDPEPNDSDLACMILDAVKTQYRSCEYSAVVQFLIDYPHMIDKLYFLIEYLQAVRHQRDNSTDSDSSSECSTVTESESDPEHDDDRDDESDFLDPDEELPGPCYCPNLADQLLGEPERSESPPPFPLLLEAVRPPKLATPQPTPEALSAPPPGVTSSWVERQLLRTRSDLSTFIDDTVFMCRLIFLNVERVNPGLQRWDLIDQSQMGVSRELFQPDGVPNRVRLLTRRRDWFRQLRHQLIQQTSYLC